MYPKSMKELLSLLQELEDLPVGISLTRLVSNGAGQKLVWANPAYCAFAGRGLDELLCIGDLRRIQVRLPRGGQEGRRHDLATDRANTGIYAWLLGSDTHMLMRYVETPMRLAEGLHLVSSDLPVPHRENPRFPGLRLNEDEDGKFFN